MRRLGIPTAEREDLEQEVMAQLWKEVNREAFEIGSGFWGFVEVVTARRSIDWLRTRRNHQPLEFSIRDRRPGPLSELLDSERRSLGFAVLSQLDKPCRDLVYLHAGLRLPYSEIAAILDKSEGALRVQMHRCIQKCRSILAARLDAENLESSGRRKDRE